MKKIFIFLLIGSFILNSFAYSNENTSNEIIAKINGEDICQKNFDRLLNVQRKKLYTDLNFNLLALPTSNPKATLKREELLRKVKEEDITANANDFDNGWEELIIRYGSIENLREKADSRSLTIADIRKRMEENILIKKLFEKETKEKLIEKFINETLILQEAKARNVNVSEEEITQKLSLLKEKQGGEEAFNKFLSKNNATLEDAKNEIKNQILVQLVKNQTSDLTNFLAMKKLKSDIIIYTSKIFPKEPDALAYPSETIKKIDEETSNIIAREIQEEETQDSNIRKKEYIITEEQPQKQNATAQPKENKIFISDIKEPTIIKPINITKKPDETTQKGFRHREDEILVPGVPETPIVTNTQENLPQNQEVLRPNKMVQANDVQNRMENSSKTLKELRRKIEQRRVTSR